MATLTPAWNIVPAMADVALQISVPTTFSWRKRTEDGTADTDLIQYGEGSGQGFWATLGDQPSGHLHLMVDWMDIADERDVRFSRGVILVDGRFFAQYIPGASASGVVEYLITTDRNIGRVAADGITPTIVEVRKYHPLGNYSSRRLVKVCPKRTQVRRDSAQRIAINTELNLTYDPWNANLRADLVLNSQWSIPAPAWRPAFVEPQLYVAKDKFTNQNTAVLLPSSDYYTGSQAHADLRAKPPVIPLAGLYNQANLPDIFSETEPPSGAQALSGNYTWTRALTQTGADITTAGKM